MLRTDQVHSNSCSFNRINGKDNVSSFLKAFKHLTKFYAVQEYSALNIMKALANNQSEVSSHCLFHYISNKMQFYTVYLYLETALHVSGGTSTHHQEGKQLYLQHLLLVTLLLLLEALAADSSNGVTNTRCCRYSCMRS
jgi:hypothetical protein